MGTSRRDFSSSWHKDGNRQVRMKIGTCKLCLTPKSELQDSHLVPAAMYRCARAPGEKNPEPYIVTPTIGMQSSKQIRDWVFCRECEKRFDSGGENYVSKMVNTGRHFRLLKTLESKTATPLGNGFDQFVGADLPIRVDQFTYFALSILWRSSIHEWRYLNGHAISIDLGAKYNEVLRKYLLGEGTVPPEITWAFGDAVCADRGYVRLPSPVKPRTMPGGHIYPLVRSS